MLTREGRTEAPEPTRSSVRVYQRVAARARGAAVLARARWDRATINLASMANLSLAAALAAFLVALVTWNARPWVKWLWTGVLWALCAVLLHAAGYALERRRAQIRAERERQLAARRAEQRGT